jgi:imidazolonepropionase-like amidohydrolase
MAPFMGAFFLRASRVKVTEFFRGFSLLSALLAAAPLCAQTYIIRNATVMTVSKGTFKGSILVKDGKIAEVGEKVMEPAGAKIIDASNQYVIPGIIDCHSHIAIDGGVNEGSISVSSMVDIKDVLNPEDIAIYRALAGGVTTANILHGSANSIGGKTLPIKMRWGKSAEGLIFEGATPGIKFALGENPKRAGNPTGRAINGQAQQGRYPATRMGVEDVIREAFNDAKVYKAEWDAYDAKQTGIPPRKDLKLEALKEVLEGKRYVHSHCYRADEILMLLRIADDYGFKIRTLQHVLEGYKVAKEIAAHGAGASTFSDWWSFKVEAFDAIPYNAAIMQKKGVLVSLNSDDAELMRHLNSEAGKAVKYGGLSETEALAMITLNPARQLGIETRVGSIEVGKDADLVIYDKFPLSDYAKVQKVLIDGTVYFDRDNEVSARPARQAQKQKLIDKEKQQRAPQGAATRRVGQ